MSARSKSSFHHACQLPNQVATMSNSLYHSLQGQYFVGYADNLFFDQDKNAWAALSNPYYSGVNLFVNVWTVTDLFEPPIGIQIWFNATLPGTPNVSSFVTPANTTCYPPFTPQVQILQASNVSGTPTDGALAFVRQSTPGETLVVEEDGKFIIPPGGNFTVFLSNTEGQNASTQAKVAFGWWEEPICCHHCY